jgi:DNA-binding MarR family transcriptional regulator/N-acetylglutamate synthase-like GNAT family acetyltransferase
MAENLKERVSAVRHFNRFITRKIGVLQEGLLHTPYSLTEARILFELGTREGLTASVLSQELGLDPGYLSRTLGRLEQQGLIEKVRSGEDERRLLLRLTASGKEAAGLLDARSKEEVSEMLSSLGEDERARLQEAMRTIERILDHGSFKYSEPIILRQPEPGDIGWVTHRHGVLYGREHGWDERFEALVARIASDFITNFKPQRERCWIAEMGGQIVGCVFLVQVDDEVAKLRLLLVEPAARGMGLGSRLVEECVKFARRAGYRKMVLWTNNVLTAARHIYQKAGFIRTAEEPHSSWGKDLVSETWELDLLQ